jgi:hypothetical protein
VAGRSRFQQGDGGGIRQQPARQCPGRDRPASPLAPRSAIPPVRIDLQQLFVTRLSLVPREIRAQLSGLLASLATTGPIGTPRHRTSLGRPGRRSGVRPAQRRAPIAQIGVASGGHHGDHVADHIGGSIRDCLSWHFNRAELRMGVRAPRELRHSFVSPMSSSVFQWGRSRGQQVTPAPDYRGRHGRELRPLLITHPIHHSTGREPRGVGERDDS